QLHFRFVMIPVLLVCGSDTAEPVFGGRAWTPTNPTHARDRARLRTAHTADARSRCTTKPSRVAGGRGLIGSGHDFIVAGQEFVPRANRSTHPVTVQVSGIS